MLKYGFLALQIKEYAARGTTINSAPVLPYVPGGKYNDRYRTYENVFTNETADADLYIYAVAPNNANFALTDWENFDCEK